LSLKNGYGKRSSVEDYRETKRGGKGVTTLNITDKTGKLIAIESVTDENDLMIINKSGVAIRTGLDEIRVMGRATQGVRLINLKNNDAIAAIAKVEVEEEIEEVIEASAETVEGVTESNVEFTNDQVSEESTSEDDQTND
jgi:Type IIA topoisomerase (DNA gyrase/topo II, topoisomerase IV), A subunit